MTRRQVLALMVTTPLALVAARVAATSELDRASEVTFVLVHGGWHGGWCWKKLTPLLREAGHAVYTPTLTGLGERSHLLTADIDLATHVRDVHMVLEYEDLRNVVLVGHSYAGMVVAGVAEVAAERLVHLVYLDAFVPEHGKALQDYAPLPPTRADGWRVPVPGTIGSFGVTAQSDIEWAAPRLGDQPLKTFTQPVELTSELHAALPKTFVQASEAPWFVAAGARAKEQGFRFYSMIAAGHDAMITRPEQLAEVLLDVRAG